MAQLPSTDWLIQLIDEQVILFHRYTEEEIVRFNPRAIDEVAAAQEVIAHAGRLTGEDRAFAHFWCGYFYAHATI